MIDVVELQNIISSLPDPDYYRGDICNVMYIDPVEQERMGYVSRGNAEKVTDMTYRKLTFTKRGSHRNYRWCLDL